VARDDLACRLEGFAHEAGVLLDVDEARDASGGLQQREPVGLAAAEVTAFECGPDRDDRRERQLRDRVRERGARLAPAISAHLEEVGELELVARGGDEAAQLVGGRHARARDDRGRHRASAQLASCAASSRSIAAARSCASEPLRRATSSVARASST
jgi:hypothetical protein